MRLIKHKTNIDFIGKRKIAIYASTLINLAILIGIATVGFNFGVDFAGGTVVELKFDHSVSAADVRKRAETGGLHDVSVQGIGGAEENTFLLRMGGVTQLNEEGAEKAKAAINGLGNVKNVYPDMANGIINFRSAVQLSPAAIKKTVARGFAGCNTTKHG